MEIISILGTILVVIGLVLTLPHFIIISKKEKKEIVFQKKISKFAH